MPWDCKACGTHVPQDDIPCVACGKAKSNWTMVVDQTRTLSVSLRKLSCLRSVNAAALTESPPASLVRAQQAYVLSKDQARALASAGEQPRADQVLFVRLHPGTTTDLTITLQVEFETQGVEELTFQPQATTPNQEGFCDARFLFVCGDGPTPSLDGLHVVDLTEESERGFAPSVEVSALKKAPRQFPTTTLLARWSAVAAQVKEEVELVVLAPGESDGAEVSLRVFEHDADGQHDAVAELTGTIRGGEARVPWTFAPMEDEDDLQTQLEQEHDFTAPEYQFEATVGERSAFSGLIQYQHWIEYVLWDAEKKPLADTPVFLELPDGSQREGRTDAQGLVRWEGIPPGADYEISLRQLATEFEPYELDPLPEEDVADADWQGFFDAYLEDGGDDEDEEDEEDDEADEGDEAELAELADLLE